MNIECLVGGCCVLLVVGGVGGVGVMFGVVGVVVLGLLVCFCSRCSLFRFRFMGLVVLLGCVWLLLCWGCVGRFWY